MVNKAEVLPQVFSHLIEVMVAALLYELLQRGYMLDQLIAESVKS
jgi:hypothetical protein